MSTVFKRAFYLDPEIEAVLAKAPPKKVSERANELMKKGLQKEQEEAVAAEYERYNHLMAKESTKSGNELTSTELSYGLFQNDDSNDEDLF